MKDGEGVLSTHKAFLASLKKQEEIRSSVGRYVKPKASGEETLCPDGPRNTSRPCSVPGELRHCHPSGIRAPGSC